MLQFVRVHHPDVGEALVPERALPHYLERGWQPADDGEATSAEEPAPAPQDGLPPVPSPTDTPIGDQVAAEQTEQE